MEFLLLLSFDACDHLSATYRWLPISFSIISGSSCAPVILYLYFTTYISNTVPSIIPSHFLLRGQKPRDAANTVPSIIPSRFLTPRPVQ